MFVSLLKSVTVSCELVSPRKENSQHGIKKLRVILNQESTY